MDPAEEIKTAATAYSLRKLTETFAPHFAGAIPMPEVSLPFEAAREVGVVREQLQAVSRAASTETLIKLRERASEPAEAGIASRLRSEEIRFWNSILIERGAARPPLNRPRREDLDIQAGALRMVIAAFMRSVDDELVIAANRATYEQYLTMDETDDSPTAQAFRLSMTIYMDFLAAFMDSTGITARFVARKQTGDQRPAVHGDPDVHREVVIRSVYNGALRLWRYAKLPNTLPLPEPFDETGALSVIREMLEHLMERHAPRETIAEMAGMYDGELAKFYRRVVARKDGITTIADQPAFESALDEAIMLQQIIGLTLTTMPDEVIIGFNQAAWRDRQEIEATGGPETVGEHAHAYEMKYYEGIMDSTGVTERFTAALKKEAH